MFYDFPYLSYNDINLDWLINRMREFLRDFGGLQASFDDFKTYVENYLENIEVADEVDRILEEWRDDGTLENMLLAYNSKHLTSNDLDLQNLYNYILEDNQDLPENPSNYPVFQGLCITPGGNFIVASQDEHSQSNQGKIREINSSGNFTGRELLAQIGHANGIAYADGKIYVTWMHEYPADTRTGKVTIIDYATMTVDRIVDLGVDVNTVAYDSDANQLIFAGFASGNTVPMYVTDLAMSGIARTYNIIKESWMDLNQDIFYFDGLIGFIGAFPNLIAFYKKDSGELVKIYNPDQRDNLGLPCNEPESCSFYNGDFYMTSYARVDDRHGLNTITKFNPWKNVYNGYYKKNRYYGQLPLYVDGDQRDPIQDGTEAHPFGHIGMAIAVIASRNNATSPLMPIRCKNGTNVGSLIFLGLNNVVLSSYPNDSGTKYILHGVRIATANGIIIENAEITYNKLSSTGTANAYNLNATIQYRNCAFNSTDGDANTGYKIACFATRGAKVRVMSGSADSGFDVGLRGNQQSEFYETGGFNNQAARLYELYEDAWIESARRVKPATSYWYRKSRALTLANPLGAVSTLGTHALDQDNLGGFDGFNMILIETIFGRRETQIVRIPSNSFYGQITLSHVYTDMWVANIEFQIDLNSTNPTIDIIDIVVHNTRTGTTYKLSDGAVAGIVYPTIAGIYML